MDRLLKNNHWPCLSTFSYECNRGMRFESSTDIQKVNKHTSISVQNRALESAILIPNHELYAQSSRHVYLRLFYAKVTVVAFCNLIYYSLESSPELIVTFFLPAFFIYLVFVSCPTAFLTTWRNKILWYLPSGICPLVCAPCL